MLVVSQDNSLEIWLSPTSARIFALMRKEKPSRGAGKVDGISLLSQHERTSFDDSHLISGNSGIPNC